MPVSSPKILFTESAADGASVPFGRSLTYRFAMVAFLERRGLFRAECLLAGHREGHCAAPSSLVAAAADDRSRRYFDLGFTYPNLGDVRGL